MSEGYSFHGPPRAGRQGDRRVAGVVVVLAVAFVSVAIVKPWGSPAEPTTTHRASPTRLVPAASIRAARPPLPGPEATMAAAPLPVAFTTPVPPLATASWSALRWQRLAPGDPLSLVTSVTRWRAGFVAIGRQDGIPATPVWTSADGTAWLPLLFATSTTEPPTRFWQGLAVLGLAQRPTGLVALTEALPYCSAPCLAAYVLPVVSWTSGDGRRWTPHLLPPEWLAGGPPGRPALFAEGPAGIVVASSGPAARLATSLDGSHWHLLPAGGFPARFALTDIHGTVSGYVAVGRWTTAGGLGSAASLWSSDGRQWSEGPTILPTTPPGPDVGSAVGSLVVGSGGVIAVGRGATSATLWWQSTDGRHWQSLSGYPPLGPTTCVGEGCGGQPDGSVVGDGGRMVALRGGADGGVWTSTDGLAWRTVAVSGDGPDTQATAAGLGNTLVLLPGGILVSDGTTTWFGEAGVE